ncbi:MAG: PHP domain-containing protein [Candidatus Eisenbacteria bacterium]
MSRVDLHLHSSASDGLFSPREVVRRAHGVGLAGISLTDHDTLAGLSEAAREAGRLGLRFVPGCEISVVHEDLDIHLLAYFVGPGQTELSRLLVDMEALRRQRIQEMVRRLRGAGVRITEEEVWVQAGGSRSVGRMHVARALVSAGHVSRLEEAFTRYIGTDNPGYVPKQTARPAQVIAAVWETGGVPVLGHPGVYGVEDPDRLVKGWDLGGIEVFHPGHSPEQERRLMDWACRREWAVTGGSDWHGENRPNAYLGCRNVDLQALNVLEKQRRLRR